MTSLMSRLSLYDLLSKVIPGYFVVYLVCMIFCKDVCLLSQDFIFIVTGFCVSYLVGVIVHRVSRVVFSWLSHNDWLSAKALERFNSDLERRRLRSRRNQFLTSQEKYYQIYFKHLANGFLYIEALEAQLAFTRSLTLVGILYSLFGCIIVSCPCWCGLFVLFTLISLYITVTTRYKIHYYYFELDHYTKDENI